MFMCVIYCIYYYIKENNKLFFHKVTLAVLHPSTYPTHSTKKKMLFNGYLIDYLF